MDQATIVPLSIGLLVLLAGALVAAGVTWGALTTKLGALSTTLDRIGKSVARLETEATAARHDLELRLALVEREAGIPVRHREDRTPVRAVPEDSR